MLPVGFADSSLATTRAAPAGTTWRSSINGVWPIASRMVRRVSMVGAFAMSHLPIEGEQEARRIRPAESAFYARDDNSNRRSGYPSRDRAACERVPMSRMSAVCALWSASILVAVAMPAFAGWAALPNAPIAPVSYGRHDDVCFFGPDSGWVVNGAGEIHRTTDG